MITLRFYGTGDKIEFNFDFPFTPIKKDTEIQIVYNGEQQKTVKYSESHPIIWFLNFFFRNITTVIQDQTFIFNEIQQKLENNFQLKNKDDFKKFIVRAAIGTCGNEVLTSNDVVLLKKYYNFLTILGKVIFTIENENLIPIDPECEIKNFFRERYEVFYGEKLLQCLDGFRKKLGLTENFPESARFYCNPISITEKEAENFEKSLEGDEWPEAFINKHKDKCVITSGEDEQSVIQAILQTSREYTNEVLRKNTELEEQLRQKPRSLTGEASGANPAVSQAAAPATAKDTVQNIVEENLKELEDELKETKKLVVQLLEQRNTAISEAKAVNENLGKSYEQFVDRTETLRTEIVFLTQSNVAANLKIEELTEINEGNFEKIDYLTKSEENKLKTIDLLQGQLSELRQQKESLQQIIDAKGDVEVLNGLVSTAQDNERKVQLELQTVRDELQSSNKQLQAIRNKLNTQIQSNKDLTATIQEKDNEIAKITDNNASLTVELEALQVNIKDKDKSQVEEEEGEESKNEDEGGEDEDEESGDESEEEDEEGGEEGSLLKKGSGARRGRGVVRGRGAGRGRGASGDGGMTRAKLIEMLQSGREAAQAKELELQRQRQLADEARRRADDALQQVENATRQVQDAQQQAAEALSEQQRLTMAQQQAESERIKQEALRTTAEALRTAAEAQVTRLQEELSQAQSVSPPGSPVILPQGNEELQAQLNRQMKVAQLASAAEQAARDEANRARDEANRARDEANRDREIARAAEEARRKAVEDLRQARNSTPPGSPVSSSGGSTPPGSPAPSSGGSTPPGVSPVAGPGMTTIMTKTFDRIVETNRRLKETLGLIVENQNNKEERNRENALWRKALHDQINDEMSLEECVELLRAAKRRMHELKSEFIGGGKKK